MSPMRALLLGLALTLTPSLALAAAPDSGTQNSTTKKKKKKKKAAQNTGLQTSPGSLSIDTSMPVTAQTSQNESDDLGIMPLDVEHMLFDAKSIQDVIKHHMPQIQSCYEKVLATSGERIEGTVTAGFIIDVTGTVTDARVLKKKSTVKDERVIDCVLLRLRRLVFPKPPDNRRYPIEFPFNLTVKK